MAFLDPVSQHRPVDFLKDVFPHFDNQIRPDAENVSIKCGMVDLTQG